MKRKKIILWSVFVFSAICLTAVGIDAILEKRFMAALWSWLMISIGFVSVKYLLPKIEQAKKQIASPTGSQ